MLAVRPPRMGREGMDRVVLVGGPLSPAPDAERRADHTEVLWGILNAIVSGATNARAEGLNSRIQAIKRRACRYRNRERFRYAIYFHLGGLDLYPERLSSAHSLS